MTLSITVVTVTYGDRWPQLRQVLEALATLDGADAISKVVVVDNGSGAETKAGLAGRSDLDVVRLDRNEGSASGFAAGIERALSHGTDYVWLLDDDNRPEYGCLKTLLAAVDEYGTGVALQAMRTAMEPLRRLAEGVPAGVVFGHRNGNLHNTLRCKVLGKPPRDPFPPGHPLMEWAVYGGFLAPRQAFQRVGLPRLDYVLYADDSDYTHRISAAGWPIRLIPQAVIEDVDDGWENVASRRQGVSNLVAPRVRQPAELRSLYYTVRNSAHFRRNRRVTSPGEYYVNVVLRLGLMFALSVLSAVRTRELAPLRNYRYYLLATWHGLRNRLGPYSRVDRLVDPQAELS